MIFYLRVSKKSCIFVPEIENTISFTNFINKTNLFLLIKIL